MGIGCIPSDNSTKQIIQIRATFKNSYIVPPKQFDSTLKCKYIILNKVNKSHKTTLEQLKLKFKATQFFQIRQLTQFQQQNIASLNNILVILASTIKDVQDITNLKIKIFRNVIIAIDQKPTIQHQQLCQLTFGYKLQSLGQFNYNFVYEAMAEASRKRLLYICSEDVELINRSNIINLVFSDRLKLHTSNQFVQLLQSKQILYELFKRQLVEKISSKTKSAKFILKDLFKKNSVVKQLIQIMAQTQNPGLLSQISWMYSLLSHYIQDWYHQHKKTYQNKQFYIVQPISTKQITKLIKSKKQNMLFSTFQLGFSDNKLAKAYLLQNPTYFMFTVTIPRNINEYLEKFDFGFYEEDGKVIFNIKNFFTIDFFDLQTKQCGLTYGSLPRQLRQRQINFRYADEQTTKMSNLRMIKLWDFHCYCNLFINSQLDLILCLQMYEIYRQYTLQNIRKTGITNPIFKCETLQSTALTNNMKDICIGINSQINQMQNIGDSYFEENNMEECVKYYASIQPIERGYAKIFHMCLEQQDQVKFRQIYSYYRTLPCNQSKNQNKVLSMILSTFSVYELMKTNTASAIQKMKDVLNIISIVFKEEFIVKYGFHSQAIFSVPFFYIFLQIQAQLQKQQGNTDAHQMRMNQFIRGWKYFRGIHIYWLP